MGRPPKNNEVGVLDRIIWVPDPLEEYVEESIRAGRVTDMQVYPSYAPGRLHKRVPASLSDGILQKIKEWKTWVKDNRKTDEHTED